MGSVVKDKLKIIDVGWATVVNEFAHTTIIKLYVLWVVVGYDSLS